jgi:putative transposase
MRERRFKKPLRYKGHDYRAPCSVHVTICTWRHQHLFGHVTPEGVVLTSPGQFTESSLLALHAPDAGIEIDTHVIMPDHLHAIIHLGTCPGITSAVSISHLIRSFKLRVLKAWPGGVRRLGWPTYDTHLWQQSYYDTLIRSDAHLETTRRYILGNPARWIEKQGQ